MSFEQRFNELDQLLQQWQWLWREVPFKQPTLSWFARHPHWQRTMDRIDDCTLARLASDTDALYTFAREHLELDIDPRFYRIEPTSPGHTPPGAAPATAPAGVKPRKWAQIAAFDTALRATDQASRGELVEWCAGKGHLSRQLLTQGLHLRATGLEIDPRLASAGEAVAQAENIPLRLLQQNVLDPSVSRFCTHESHHIALHACGKLHISMLQHCCAQQVMAIDLVPCCYHLIDDTTYTPLSSHARRSSLQLDDDALKLALQETVTAPGNARRNRERLQQWRLGFDCLQRALRSVDRYLPLPSLSVTQAGGNFRAFCQHCAAHKHLELPPDTNYARFETLGRQRFAQVSRYDLIRQLFRRPLELWLVYDRCLLLEEHGYDVALQEFCARAVTPRNLRIRARRRDRA